MHIKKLLLFTSLVLMCLNQLSAQQFPIFNFQTQNMMLLNPAYTGEANQMIAHLHYRKQWIGVQGVPETMAAAFQMPIKSSRASVGLRISSERLNLLNQTAGYLSYSYLVPLNEEKLYLSLGLSGGFVLNSVDLSRVTAADASADIAYLQSEVDGQNNADANFGIAIHFSKWEIGFSSNHLFARTQSNLQGSPISMSLFNFAYEVETPDQMLTFKPIMVYRFSNINPGQFEFALMTEFQDRFWFSVGNRTQFGLIAGAGVKIKDRLNFGYGYENSSQGVGAFGQNTHELMLSFTFGEKKLRDMKKKPKLVKDNG